MTVPIAWHIFIGSEDPFMRKHSIHMPCIDCRWLRVTADAFGVRAARRVLPEGKRTE